MYNVLKDFAGPIATAMAAIAAVSVTAYFAWHQKRLAAEKIRLDLFERRFAILNSIFDFYFAIISWQKNPSADQIEAKKRFFLAYQESFFLFEKESGINSLLKQLIDAGNKVINFREREKHNKGDVDSYVKDLKEISRIQTYVFEDRLSNLRAAIYKYLYVGGL